MTSVFTPGVWPAHPEETERLRALEDYRQLETGVAPREVTTLLDSLTQLGCEHFGVPICMITLIDEEKQHHIGTTGVALRFVSRAASFCTHGLSPNVADVFSVSDAACDSRFSTNPLVLGDPHIRFYAGTPLVHRPTGQRLGMLCIISDEPRKLAPTESPQLRAAAAVVMECLEALSSPMPYAPDASAIMLARFTAQLQVETKPGVAAPPNLPPSAGVEAVPQSLTVPMPNGGGPPTRPTQSLLVKSLGWFAVHVTAERLAATLRDSCLHLGAPPISVDLASHPMIPERKLAVSPVSQGAVSLASAVPGLSTPWVFGAQTAPEPDSLSILVIISVWVGVSGTHDIQARRASGDTLTYHQFLVDLQAELYKRLPEVSEGTLVLRRR